MKKNVDGYKDIDGDWIIKHKEAEQQDIPMEKEAIKFLDAIRDYERESGNRICEDDRTSKELYDIFQSPKEEKES